MNTFRSLVDRVLAGVLVLLMFVAVINVLWQVFTRWVLNDPSAWTEELARYLLIWIGLLGAAYAAGRQMHLAIDLLPNHLDGARRHALEIAIDVVILAFAIGVMIVGGYRLVSLTLLMGQQSAALGLQLGWVYSVIPLSGAIIAFYSIESMMQRVRAARGRSADVGQTKRSSHEID
jgi:TRAP-type C4-dicarboxylate transport system permease small subunit